MASSAPVGTPMVVTYVDAPSTCVAYRTVPMRTRTRLTPIGSDKIRPGFRLPGALRDENGRVLLSAGVELTDEHIRLLNSANISELFGGSDWDAAATMTRDRGSHFEDMLDSTLSVSGISDPYNEIAPPCNVDAEELSVAALRVDMRLAQDLYDESDVLLLAAGMRVTPRFLELLSERRIKTVRMHRLPDEDAGEAPESVDTTASTESEVAPRIKLLDEILSKELQASPRMQSIPLWRRPRLPLDTMKTEAVGGLKRHIAASQSLAHVGESLQLGGSVSVGHVQDTLRDFANMVTLDFDLLPLIVSLQRTQDEYLFDHCVNTAMLAMTVAAQLGLRHEQIMEVGLSGLLHDVGMLRVPGRVRLAPRKLTPTEWKEIERHPYHTLEMLDGVRGLPPVVRLVVYQVHERWDGSGYPRRRARSALHPYSAIVAVADAYAAMTRRRPYRAPLSPYEAARTVLQDAGAEKIDRHIVRGFLDAVALCPIGSIAELSDGRKAKVLRANPGWHTRPIVEILDAQGQPTSTLLDLSKETDLKLIRAHAAA